MDIVSIAMQITLSGGSYVQSTEGLPSVPGAVLVAVGKGHRGFVLVYTNGAAPIPEVLLLQTFGRRSAAINATLNLGGKNGQHLFLSNLYHIIVSNNTGVM